MAFTITIAKSGYRYGGIIYLDRNILHPDIVKLVDSLEEHKGETHSYAMIEGVGLVVRFEYTTYILNKEE